MTATRTRSAEQSFSSDERAAMKERAKELKKEAKRSDGLQDLMDSIAKMDSDDRTLAEHVHAAVTAAAPELTPKTWYGMPAYANAEGKVVVFFQNAGKFKYRYATLGFQDTARIDAGDMWPVGFALSKWTPAVEKQVKALVAKAVS